MTDLRPLDQFPWWSLAPKNGPAGAKQQFECAVQPERGMKCVREVRRTKQGAIEAAVRKAWAVRLKPSPACTRSK